jgi:hypothetical protein
MPRNPFDAHLCARSPTAAAAWSDGFNAAATWIHHMLSPAGTQWIYEVIRDSDYGADWASLPFPYEPWWEGWALGIYGHIALTRHDQEDR